MKPPCFLRHTKVSHSYVVKPGRCFGHFFLWSVKFSLSSRCIKCSHIVKKENAKLVTLLSLQIYNKLRTVEHMTIYEKEAIPSRFYYKKGKFVSPLTLVADEGWFITEVIIELWRVHYTNSIKHPKVNNYSAFALKGFCFHLSVLHGLTSTFRDAKDLVRWLCKHTP